MNTEMTIALIAAVGGYAAIREFSGGVWRWLTGWQKAERDALQLLEAERVSAAAALDEERRYTSRVEEQLYFMRSALMKEGHPLLPPFPERIPPKVLAPYHHKSKEK